MNNWCICWVFTHPLNAESNPICHLLALLGGATIVVVSRLRVNKLNKSASRLFYYTGILWCTVNKTLSLNLCHSYTVCLLTSLLICCYSESKHSIMSLLCSCT